MLLCLALVVKMGEHNSKRLSFAYNALEEMPTKILKKHNGSSLLELDMAHNRIREFRFLVDLPKLETLIADHNGITSQVKFPVLTSLRTLWVNHNKITNLALFISTISQSFPNLRILSMMNNAAAPSYFNGGTFIQYTDYRHYAISQLPYLEVLDDARVTYEERTEAERIYAKIMPQREDIIVHPQGTKSIMNM